jgi:hypothetical protein
MNMSPHTVYRPVPPQSPALSSPLQTSYLNSSSWPCRSKMVPTILEWPSPFLATAGAAPAVGSVSVGSVAICNFLCVPCVCVCVMCVCVCVGVLVCACMQRGQVGLIGSRISRAILEPGHAARARACQTHRTHQHTNTPTHQHTNTPTHQHSCVTKHIHTDTHGTHTQTHTDTVTSHYHRHTQTYPRGESELRCIRSELRCIRLTLGSPPPLISMLPGVPAVPWLR